MLSRHSLSAFLLTGILFAACRSTDPVTPGGGISTRGVYVVNEGGFSGGGSLSYYDKQRDTLFNNVVGEGLNWLFPNDMKIIGNKGYVVVNGTDEIDVIDLSSNQRMRSIRLPASSGPEYLASDASTLYVANMNGTISSIALSNDSLLGASPAAVSFPGGIAIVDGKIVVSDYGSYSGGTFQPGHMLKLVSTVSLAITDSVRVGSALGGLAGEAGGLYVVSTGNSTVYQIDVNSLSIRDSVRLGGSLAGDIASDSSALYVLGVDSVARLSIAPLGVSRSSFVKRSTGNFYYALAVDGSNGDLYISNIVGSSTGQVEIYTSSGARKRPALTAGIFPGAFAFKM